MIPILKTNKLRPLALSALLVAGGCYRSSNSSHKEGSEIEKEPMSTDQPVSTSNDTDDGTLDDKIPRDSDQVETDSFEAEDDDSEVDTGSDWSWDTGDTNDSDYRIDAGSVVESDAGPNFDPNVDPCQVDIHEEFLATRKYPVPCKVLVAKVQLASSGTGSESETQIVNLFDEFGVLKEERYCEAKGWEWTEGRRSRTLYTHNEDGQLVRTEYLDYEDSSSWSSDVHSTSMTVEYSYDDKGRLKEERADVYSFRGNSLTTYTYDKSDRLVEREYSNHDGFGSARRKTTYTYNDQGQLESTREECESSGKGGIAQWVYETVFTYDNFGNKVSERTTTIDYNVTEVVWPPVPEYGSEPTHEEWSYTYDEQGNMISAVLTTDAALFPDTVLRTEHYEYDEYGNLISMKFESGSDYSSESTYIYDCYP